MNQPADPLGAELPGLDVLVDIPPGPVGDVGGREQVLPIDKAMTFQVLLQLRDFLLTEALDLASLERLDQTVSVSIDLFGFLHDLFEKLAAGGRVLDRLAAHRLTPPHPAIFQG